MIAMQYNFVLPADYDMSIVDRRITEKGPLLDNFPNLKFKAYLTARRNGDETRSQENLYAPFYVWNHGDGLNDFVCGDGFAVVSQSFGWPRVNTWIVWRAHLAKGVAQAVFATREILATAPHAALGELRKRESADAVDDVESGGALASVAAFEPTTWTRVRFQLWRERPAPTGAPVQTYKVGHLSLPAARLKHPGQQTRAALAFRAVAATIVPAKTPICASGKHFDPILAKKSREVTPPRPHAFVRMTAPS